MGCACVLILRLQFLTRRYHGSLEHEKRRGKERMGNWRLACSYGTKGSRRLRGGEGLALDLGRRRKRKSGREVAQVVWGFIIGKFLRLFIAQGEMAAPPPPTIRTRQPFKIKPDRWAPPVGGSWTYSWLLFRIQDENASNRTSVLSGRIRLFSYSNTNWLLVEQRI